MKYYDPFVLPFLTGIHVICIFLIIKFTRWIIRLEKVEKLRIRKGIFSRKTGEAIKEVCMESLLHRKIFRKNKILGYMHMSLAFGWFLLIVVGKLETLTFNGDMANPIYLPIFFRYFEPGTPEFFLSETFDFLMDLFLLFVLSGVVLAIIKRFRSRIMGMKRTTKLKWGDKLALMSLWWIFPLRLLAESFTSGANGSGSFLTGSLGSWFSGFLPVESLAYPVWWAYSFSLFFFFISLPFSRYMHIPTEVLLIFLRKYGVRSGDTYLSYSEIETHSCSSCGICLDACQLLQTGEHRSQSVYFIQALRQGKMVPELALNCLHCGRCEEACPVGIDLKKLRLGQRNGMVKDVATYDYIIGKELQQTEVIYFAGCMTHLIPGIKQSMVNLLDYADVDYQFMDKDGSICCGRPLMLAGQPRAAKKLMDYNREIIFHANAKILVTSCPICYKIFKEEYCLRIEVLHHSEYLLCLMKAGRLSPHPLNISASYHDPCELGRGSGVYEEPRKLLQSAVTLVSSGDEKKDALCCGGSLANFQLNTKQVDIIREQTLESLTVNHPEILATSCPLCKKTLTKSANIPVKDIAEIMAEVLGLVAQRKIPQKEIVREKVMEKG